MSYKAVIGAQFGDEGKGLVTDYLCSHAANPIVVRYCGGQQAGHTVVLNNQRHVFSNFGSGTLRGAPTYWTKYCTFDPVGVDNELKKLHKLDLPDDPSLYVDYKSPVTTPYDKHKNQNSSEMLTNGTCGAGVGTTWQREEDHYHLLFEDLFYSKVLEIKLDKIRQYYKARKDQNFNDFLEQCAWITSQPNIKLTTDVLLSLSVDHTDVIFEGAQGMLLDQKHGFFPNVTRGNTGMENLNKLLYEEVYSNDFDLFLVSRAYQTRHGAGPMTNTDIPHSILIDPDETNTYNKYQGKFRRSLLDVDLLEYSLHKLGMQDCNLVLTCLDHIVNDYRFTYNDKIIKCENEEEFIYEVSHTLSVDADRLFVSSGPTAEDIKPAFNPNLKLIKWIMPYADGYIFHNPHRL